MYATQLLELAKSLSPQVADKITMEDMAWFVSYQIADSLEDLSTKELAGMINSGELYPVTNEEDIQKWLDYMYDMYENDEEDNDEELLIELTGLLGNFGYDEKLKKD